MANVYFKFGTQAQFDAVEVKDVNSLYWIEDTQRLYKGDELFAIGKLSGADGNILTLREDGLYVPTSGDVSVPEYALERMGDAEDGYFATYKLKKTINGESEYVGDAINIKSSLVWEEI